MLSSTIQPDWKIWTSFRRPDFGLIPVEKYFSLKRRRQLDYITSTGCLFRCAFCADPFVYNRGWSAVSPSRLADEIEQLWQQHRFTDLNFQDETFFTYTNRVAEISEEFLRRDMKFTWAATMRARSGRALTGGDLRIVYSLRLAPGSHRGGVWISGRA